MRENFGNIDSQNLLPELTDVRASPSRQSLEESKRLLSLASDILHDVNNLLLGIQFASKQLLAGISSDDVNYSTVLAIEEARQQAVDLTRQFRDAKTRTLTECSGTDLNELVRRWEPTIIGVIRESVIVNFDLTSQPAIVMVRQETVERILLQLILTSLAMISDGGWLMIQTCRSDEEKAGSSDLLPPFPFGSVRLIVSDTGYEEPETVASGGLAEENVVANAVKKKTMRRSTIEIVSKIVGDCDGKIVVTASENTGTKVNVFLPALPAVDVSQMSTLDSPKAVSGVETILVVDDDAHVRTFIKCILESYGYKVLEAHDLCSAMSVASANSDSLHLLLTDLRLAGTSGREIADTLRSGYRELPVIYMSGMAPDDFSSDSSYIFLEKPFQPIELLKLVRKALENQRISS